MGAPDEDVFEGNGCNITPDNETTYGCQGTSRIDSVGNGFFNSISTYSVTITTADASGHKSASYAARSASPTLEDFGTGALRGGAANVSLDRTFAGSIAPNYLVFITPDGDANSLYVAQKTASGFVVRESKGGRSTLAFDYRIVARPLDAKATHMPAIVKASMHR